MNTLLLELTRIPEAISYILESYKEDVELNNIPEEISRYETFFQLENIHKNAEIGSLLLFGCFEDTILRGVAVLDRSGIIICLCVKNIDKDLGIEKLLFQSIYHYCTTRLVVTLITANVRPQHISTYSSLGFTNITEDTSKDNRSFIPMEFLVSPADLKSHTNSSKTVKFAIAGLAVLIIAALVLIVIAAQKIITSIDTHEKQKASEYTEKTMETYVSSSELQNPFESILNQPKEGQTTSTAESGSDNTSTALTAESESDGTLSFFASESESSSTLTSSTEKANTDDSAPDNIKGIKAYIADNLTYQVKESSYQKSEDGDKKTIDFDIKYPQITNLGNQNEEKINSMIKEMAMGTAESLYLNPSDQTKQFLQRDDFKNNLYLASEVKYKITYMDENFMSIVFLDHYFYGSIYGESTDMYTLNINLKTGERYRLSKIVDVDDKFTEAWHKIMLKEAPDSVPLQKIPIQKFKSMLEGNFVDNRYYTNFFMTADGFEMGFTYHYNDGNLLSRGWIDAPCKIEELKPYASNSSFWSLVH